MKLSDWMAREGIDDETFGKALGADRATVNRIRRGINRPSWELAGKIKTATHDEVTADDFLPEQPEQPAQAAAS